MWIYQHRQFQVIQIPVLRDNYIYLIQDSQSDAVLVVDPALADPVMAACEQHQLKPTHILNTHHHWDHTDGNAALVERYQCTVVGNHADATRIPHIQQHVSDTTALRIGALNIQVIDVPGHTLGHIAFVIDDALFCGDTMFGAGCGRLFEGSHAQMWQSLQKLAALDEATQVYCAHEYTLPNLKFARNIDGENPILKQRISNDTQTRRNKQPTIPSTIALEKQTNPFLRPLDHDFCLAYNQAANSQLDAQAIFKAIRDRKNKW
ncbi:MAG: hydroxyacylglutathione hydrolase [Ghiorsea sp.]